MIQLTPIVLAILYAIVSYKFSAWKTKNTLNSKSVTLEDETLEALNNRIESLVEENGMEGVQKLAEPYRNQSKLIKNVDFTIEDGLHVFSKWYLIKQGECCNNGCSNCPY